MTNFQPFIRTLLFIVAITFVVTPDLMVARDLSAHGLIRHVPLSGLPLLAQQPSLQDDGSQNQTRTTAECAPRKKPYEWINFQVPPEFDTDVKDADVNQIIEKIRNKYGVKVLVFGEYPKDIPRNPTLVISNSDEEKAAKDKLIAMAQTAWHLEGQALAQYIPAYHYNKPSEEERPLLKEGVLTLGRSATEASVTHEFLHHLYQKHVYRCWYDGTNEGRPHPYTEMHKKHDNAYKLLQEKVDKFNETPETDADLRETRWTELLKNWLDWKTLEFQSWEGKIEEAIVWDTTYQLGKRVGFARRQQEDSIWKHWTYVDEIDDYADETFKDEVFQNIESNLKFLDQVTQKKFTELRGGLTTARKEVSNRTANIINEASSQKMEAISSEIFGTLLKKGRLKVGGK